jgi:hypothetical protein
MRIQTERPLSGPINGGYSFRICAAALVLTAMAVSVESSMATARSGPHSTVELVDRAHKGDRLPLARAQTKASRLTVSASTLPEGCDSAVSSLTRSDLARVAQRCES